jgi:hypothetical protein
MTITYCSLFAIVEPQVDGQSKYQLPDCRSGVGMAQPDHPGVTAARNSVTAFLVVLLSVVRFEFSS